MKLHLPLLALLLVLPMPLKAQEIEIKPVMVDDMKAVFGTVESVKTTPARARVEGKVESLSVAEGDEVQAGQTLAKIYDAKLKLNLQALDAKIKALEADRAVARTDFQRAQKLHDSGAIAQADFDKIKGRMNALDSAVDAAKAERSVTAEQHNEADVLAPAAGRVLKVNVVNGAVVRPGENVAEIATSSNVLRLRLPERHARFIKQGDKVLIASRGRTGEGNNGQREGVVRLVYPELEQGRVIADVEAEGIGGYFVGERVRVYINAGKRQTFLVPTDDLIYRSGVALVRLRSGEEVIVQPGQTRDGYSEILSGIKTGDVVVKP